MCQCAFIYRLTFFALDKSIAAERLPLTSASLMGGHASNYHHLFERCSTVVSAPLGVSLTGDRALTTRRAAVMLQLPRRVFVGIEKHNAQGAPAAIVHEYDVSRDAFTPSPTTLTGRVAHVVSDLLHGEHVTLHILAEGQDGRNLALPAALSVALGLTRHLANGRLTPTAIAAWHTKSCAALLGEAAFFDLLGECWDIQKILRPGMVTGGSVISALLPSAAHALAFGGTPLGVCTPGQLDGLPPSPSNWPVDIALISTGTRNDLGLPPEVLLDDDATRRFISDAGTYFSRDLPLVQTLQGSGGDALDALRDRAFLDVYRGWFDLWRRGGGGYAIDQLIEAYVRREALLWATENLHPSIRETLHELRALLGRKRYGSFPQGTGIHGGSILIVTPQSEARADIEELPAHLQSRGIERACTEYLSWRDQTTFLGPRVEQHLASGIFHASIPRAARRITRFSSGGFDERISGTDEDHEGTDIVVDVTGERIAIAGRPVDSRELPSQRATSHILAQLLRRPSMMIQSDELPRSSYKDSRSELTSKLVSPLLRVLKLRTGKTMRISTSGTISSFSIALKLDDVVIDLSEALTP